MLFICTLAILVYDTQAALYKISTEAARPSVPNSTEHQGPMAKQEADYRILHKFILCIGGERYNFKPPSLRRRPVWAGNMQIELFTNLNKLIVPTWNLIDIPHSQTRTPTPSQAQLHSHAYDAHLDRNAPVVFIAQLLPLACPQKRNPSISSCTWERAVPSSAEYIYIYYI